MLPAHHVREFRQSATGSNLNRDGSNLVFGWNMSFLAPMVLGGGIFAAGSVIALGTFPSGADFGQIKVQFELETRKRHLSAKGGKAVTLASHSSIDIWPRKGVAGQRRGRQHHAKAGVANHHGHRHLHGPHGLVLRRRMRLRSGSRKASHPRSPSEFANITSSVLLRNNHFPHDARHEQSFPDSFLVEDEVF